MVKLYINELGGGGSPWILNGSRVRIDVTLSERRRELVARIPFFFFFRHRENTYFRIYIVTLVLDFGEAEVRRSFGRGQPLIQVQKLIFYRLRSICLLPAACTICNVDSVQGVHLEEIYLGMR